MSEAMDILEARLNRRREQLQRFQDNLNAIRCRVTSSDGAVTVVVDGVGVLAEVEFSDAVWHYTPEHFDKTLTGTADAALRGAMTERVALVEEFNREIAE